MTQKTEAEAWKPFDEWYDVSSLGRVRSWIASGGKRITGQRSRRSVPKILKLRPDAGGYLQWSRGRNDDTSVHRAVALLWIGLPPTPQHEVAHNNGDKKDNRVSNLRWATHADNLRDRIKHGTNYRTNLTGAMVRGIREEHALGYGTTYMIGVRYGVSQTTVARILRKDTWAHV